MANATTYLASPTFGIGAAVGSIKDLTDQCMSRHVLKVNRVAIGHNQSHRSIVVWQCKWDGWSGFGCTTTLPAPRNFLFSCLP